MYIREASDSDLDDVLLVESAAFGHDKEAGLVRNLLGDASARPALSLLALKNDGAVGHILFTAVRLTIAQNTAAILAPLAIVPDSQKQGIGGKLIEKGLQILSKSGVDLVFVLGHPGPPLSVIYKLSYALRNMQVLHRRQTLIALQFVVQVVGVS